MLAGRDRGDKGGPRPSGFSLSLHDGRFGPASVGDKEGAKPTVVKKVSAPHSEARADCFKTWDISYGEGEERLHVW